MKKWIDISQVLSIDSAVWPGDTPFNYELSHAKKETGSANVGRISTSLHCGTHVDAPFHFQNNGKRIDEIDINIYIGLAKIIDVTSIDMINNKVLEKYDLTGVKRLIIKTENSRVSTVFPNEFTVFDQEVGAYLQKKGIFLVGTDAPSVDPENSQTMSAHHALANHGIHILENLLLNDIEPGDYELIALPLKLAGADGSPVRAVIRRL